MRGVIEDLDECLALMDGQALVTEDKIEKVVGDAWFKVYVVKSIPHKLPGVAGSFRRGEYVWAKRKSANEWHVAQKGLVWRIVLNRKEAKDHLSTVYRPVLADRLLTSMLDVSGVMGDDQ